MQGNSPLDHLPRMYDALQHYAGHFDCVEDELQEACEAIEGDDVEGFKLIAELGCVTVRANPSVMTMSRS
jgi:hypothetical protein